MHDLFLQLSGKVQSIHTNYHTLVNLVNDYTTRTGEHVLLVNFNYDLLMEQALRRSSKYTFDSLHDYVDYAHRKILLFKPHGSCNFIRKFQPQIVDHIPSLHRINSITILSQILYSRSINFDTINRQLQPETVMFEGEEVLGVADSRDKILYLPQLLLPYKSKDDFVMPQDHTHLLQHLLSSIDEILVIGWKGTETKFQKLLKSKLFDREVIITPVTNGDDSVKQQFQESIPKAMYKKEPQTFSEYMQQAIRKNKSIFN